MPKQNTCSEQTIKKAFQRVLGGTIQFNDDMSPNDDQIDISLVFVKYEAENHLWTSGNNEAALLDDFSRLDKAKTYFIRSGKIDGAGHYQLLYFSESKKGWQGFSSETLGESAFTLNDEITEEAQNKLMTRGLTASWGMGNGQYCIAVREATKERIIAAANFVHDYRMQPIGTNAEERTGIAIEHLYTDGEPQLNCEDGFITDEGSEAAKEEAIARYIDACNQYMIHLFKYPNDKIAREKWDVINYAQEQLTAKEGTNQSRIDAFTGVLKMNGGILSVRRDSGFITFVKALGLLAATIFTLGTASYSTYHSLFGDNATHGKKFLQEVDAAPSSKRPF